MTVCIAAVCNLGPDRPIIVVAAADRMITIDGLGYEPKQRKMVVFAERTIGLLAGDMQLHAAVVPRTRERIRAEIKERESDDERVTVEQVANAYAAEFGIYLRAKVERELLVRRGLTLEKFYQKQHEMPHYQRRDIDDAIQTYHIEASAIIAGLDHTGGHIYKVSSPGVPECFDTTCFACIGSGAPLATTPFVLAKYDKTWPAERALLLTFSAKMRAEETTNVGGLTDAVIIRPGREIMYLSDAEEARLKVIVGEQIKKEKEAEEAAYEQLLEYIRALNIPQSPTEATSQTTLEDATSQATAEVVPAAKMQRKRRKPPTAS